MWVELGQQSLEASVIGYKAYNLQLMSGSLKLKVPPSYLLDHPFVINTRTDAIINIYSTLEIVDCLNKIMRRSSIMKYPLIIRSSTNIEDQVERSCAGLFKSIKNITEESQLLSTINSIIEPVTFDTFEKYGIPIDTYKINILAQPFLQCKTTLIVFTHDTIFKSSNYLVEFYENGNVVSLISLDKSGIIVKTHSEIKKNYLYNLIDNKLLKKLSDILSTIITLFNSHQNVELGIFNKELIVFQSRPITI
jgi:phosphoenolpyruvate synthase/pyruvate phosphate dikinase